MSAQLPGALPADPLPVTDGDVTVADLHGLKVLVKKVPTAELTTAQLYIRGGARNWGKDDAGVERVALAMAASGGTQALGKVAFGERLATLGTSIGANSGRDYAWLGFKALNRNFAPAFDLLAQSFLTPAMPASELELVREQAIVGLQREDEQPEGRLAVLTNATLFKGTIYENRAEGTIPSISKLTLAQAQAHLAKLRETSRLLLVVVGGVEPAEVIALAANAFGGLPKGSYVDTPLPHPTFAQATLTVEERKIPTNYLRGFHSAPGVGQPGYAAAQVTAAYLWDKLFEEVRTKRNLSYAPGAGMLVTGGVSMGFVGVSAVDPNAAYKVMLDVLRGLQTTPLTEAELAGAKAEFLTNFLMGAAATDGQAEQLAFCELSGGSWKLARTFAGEVSAVTPAEVQAYAKAHMSKLQTVMLGDPAKLDKGLATSL
ncbi:MAG: insulinase family protein [Deltaproteobacteria bacterium]|nr:insulinase family protein [Deltaproteobacteria bacterium]